MHWPVTVQRLELVAPPGELDGRERRLRGEDSGVSLNVYAILEGGYINPTVYSIESDASSATHPLPIAAITGTHLLIIQLHAHLACNF